MNFFRNLPLKLVFIALALTILTAFAYWPTRHHEFVDYDDNLYVSENFLVQRGLTLEGVQWAFTANHAANWHPLTWISHMLDCELFGVAPGAHHLVSLFIHIVNALLLLFLLHRLTGAVWKSAFVAALFALHPLHVESVAWVSERKDVLCGFFALLSIWFYAGYACKQIGTEKGEPSGAERARLNYFLSLLFFAAGLMAKPMLVTLPFVYLLLDFWPLNRITFARTRSRIGALILEKVPFLALAIVSCVITFVAQKTSGAVVTLSAVPFTDRIATAATAYTGYLVKMIWPLKLAAFYPRQVHSGWEVVVVLLILISISVAVVRLVAQKPYAFVSWLWYLGMLVPVIGLVQVGDQAMADRYTYLPLIGIFIGMTWGMVDLVSAARFKFVLGSIACAVLVACLALTRGQVAYWKNTEVLAEHALRVTERNSRMLDILASVRIDQGRFDDAIALLTEAPDLNVGQLATLGNALQKAGRSDEAMFAFKKALASDPSNANAQNNIGFYLLEQGKLDEAIPHLEAALKFQPVFPQALYNMGTVCFRKGDVSGAISHYKNAIRLSHGYVDAQCNLGMALLKSGKAKEGLPHIRTAIRLRPDFGRAHHHLSQILFQLGQFSEAEEAARRAVQLEPEQPLMHYQLALALDAQEKKAEAAPIFLQILEIAKNAGDEQLALEINQRLAAY